MQQDIAKKGRKQILINKFDARALVKNKKKFDSRTGEYNVSKDLQLNTVMSSISSNMLERFL